MARRISETEVASVRLLTLELCEDEITVLAAALTTLLQDLDDQGEGDRFILHDVYLFRELGKPQLLKYLGIGVWSRQLIQEHRLVYLVSADRVDFLQARYHY